MNWPAVSLGEISKSVDYGLTTSATDEPIGPKFLRITDIQDDYVDWNSVPYCKADSAKLEANRLAPGDIVFARTGATTGKSFLIRQCPDNSVFASYLIRVRPGPKLDPGFLARFFQSDNYWSQIRMAARGAAQPGVNSTVLKSLKIPLPPLDQQRRIAAILDAADALRAMRRQALTKVDSLMQSIFINMFGDPATNSKKWPIVCIGDLLSSTQYGTNEKAGVDGATPILRMNNISYDGKVDCSDLKYIDMDDDDLERYSVVDGDILFNRTNSPELVGKTAVYRGNRQMVFAGYLVRLRTNDRAVPDYISVFLNSKYGKAILRGMCKSIIGMANINATEVQTVRIPEPPIDLQVKFAGLVLLLSQQHAAHDAALEKSGTLFSSLQNKAFHGEL